MQLNRFLIRPFIEAGLREELASGDTTGGFLVLDDDPIQTGQIYAKDYGIACGLLLADETIRMLDESAEVEHAVRDGDEIAPGTTLLKIKARTSTFFAIERCALDWIQQLSGIATKTRRYMDMVQDSKVRITDTRKGWPSLRILQKYAVRIGGAHNHIFNLSNCILIKDNHIKAAGSLTNAVNTIRSHAQHTFKIEAECETLDMVHEALDAKVEIIMFDNMDLDEMREGLKIVNGRAMTEASGGINETTIGPISQIGVDIISLGDLTHSIKALDVSLDIKDIKPSALRTIQRMEENQ